MKEKHTLIAEPEEPKNLKRKKKGSIKNEMSNKRE